LRSPWPETSFCLICEGDRDVDLEITLRAPVAGPVRIAVNDQDLRSVEVGERWTKAELRIDRKGLRRGLNRLSLRWPLPAVGGEGALTAAVDRLELGVAADVHPVFGEVFSVVARPRPKPHP